MDMTIVGSISPLAGSPKDAVTPSADAANVLFSRRTGSSSPSSSSSRPNTTSNWLLKRSSRAFTFFFGTKPVMKNVFSDCPRSPRISYFCARIR